MKDDTNPTDHPIIQEDTRFMRRLSEAIYDLIDGSLFDLIDAGELPGWSDDDAGEAARDDFVATMIDRLFPRD